MKDKFLCVMAQFDDETELKLKEIQEYLYEKGFIGKQTPNLPNHITLGTFHVEREEEMKLRIKGMAKVFNSFDINLGSIGLFGLDVLFIAPTINHELLNLQQPFSERYVNELKWVPHTTMLIDEPENVQKALPYLAEKFSSFTGKIESISLYEFWPTRFICEEKLG